MGTSNGTVWRPSGERSHKAGRWLQQDTFSESDFVAKYAELRGFNAVLRGKPQGFSAVETVWRREVDSNFKYPFTLGVKAPYVSPLPAFRPRCGLYGEGI
jgi:hypothetical protein